MVTYLIVAAVVGFVLLGVLPRVLKVLFLRFIIGKAASAIGEEGLARTPATITLTPAQPDALEGDEELVHWERELATEGFTDPATYTVAEMPGLVLRLLTHPDEGFAAALYSHPQAGQWCDVVVRYVDGSSASYANRAASGMDAHPDHPQTFMPGASATDLFAATRAGLERKLRKPFLPESVAADFMAAYAREMAWRHDRGVRPREVARIAAGMK